mmetsp:Transcript_8614/g.24752  ORF Transcript_8614/g.24752 Transcript_8614/m.24752 type:complete len:708 (+) Transcript_8614:78-2201(+)
MAQTMDHGFLVASLEIPSVAGRGGRTCNDLDFELPSEVVSSAMQSSRTPSKDTAFTNSWAGNRRRRKRLEAPAGKGHGARGAFAQRGRASSMASVHSLVSMWSDTSDERRRVNMSQQASMFVDPEEMKKQLRRNLTQPAYDVAQYYYESGLWRHIATHPLFDKLTLIIIALNAIWIGIDTDYNKSDTLLQAHPVFQGAEQFFCVYFSFEWFVRFMSFKRKRDGLRDAWFVFDSSLVFMMVAETWILTIMIFSSGAAGGGGMNNASILRMARLARLSRMARMARLLRAMPELLILIKGIAAAARSVFFTLVLLCVLLYIFAIAFTQLTVGTSVGKEHFSQVGGSMYTLLVYGTLMDNIGACLTKLGKEHFVLGALFVVFVLLAALTLMNMLIGVLTDVVSAVAATEKESATIQFVANKMRKVVARIDKDSDGKISRKEFDEILLDKDATKALHEVDVDVLNLIDFADFIFAGDGEDEEGEDLDWSKFIDVVLSLRGCNHATVKDIVNLRKFVSNALQAQRTELRKMKDDLIGRIVAVGGGERVLQRRFSTRDLKVALIQKSYEAFRGRPSSAAYSAAAATKQCSECAAAAAMQSHDLLAQAEAACPPRCGFRAAGHFDPAPPPSAPPSLLPLLVPDDPPAETTEPKPLRRPRVVHPAAVWAPAPAQLPLPVFFGGSAPPPAEGLPTHLPREQRGAGDLFRLQHAERLG